MPFCRICSQYLERHADEVLSPTNRDGAALNRLLEVRQLGGLGQEAHTTLPGQLLHERAALELGIVLPPRRPQ